MGPVVFQIYGTSEPTLADPIVRWAWSNVRRIWPYAGSSFTWAPNPALDNDALLAFADTIAAGPLREGARQRRRQEL
jgi:hypothetical protein